MSTMSERLQDMRPVRARRQVEYGEVGLRVVDSAAMWRRDAFAPGMVTRADSAQASAHRLPKCRGEWCAAP